ncbi:hypothetical protein H6P81_004381 [Aristolochia fimbriata]|uniref:DYW domain-containing protein n=1 Tax=Aristolochia fimbriata TaxID=158543 RepID=A0AAV7FI01_ARIFI|nr:hypothetical protein H6P81_004381 [Aristolochia fimbriata]
MRFSSVCCQYYLNDANAILSANSRIAHHARVGEIRTARRIFDELPHKSVVSWNSIISGYFQNGRPDEALRLFDRMPERNMASWNGVVSGYVKNGMMKEATRVFDVMPKRNVVSWTAMIRGHVQEGKISEAETLFRQMPERNVVSWTVMLGGLIQDGRIDDARQLFDQMPEKDVVARTSMIGGYCQDGRVADARKIFDEMPRRNVITWTTMISGYAHNLMVDVAHKLFVVMPEKNEVSWTAMLTGYINCSRLEEAMKLFEVMPDKSLTACNVMLLGLGKNGMISEARRIFESMGEKDDGTWSAMVKGYERSGFELEALDAFRCMQRVGVKANYPALISVLTVCSTLAFLDHGREIHAEIVKLGFNTDVFVTSALITMYIKCGNLVRAETLFRAFASKDVVMWNSMITGYAQHGLGENALRIFSEMRALGLVPDDITFVGVLSACSYTGKVKEGKEFFKMMVSDYRIEPRAPHYACMVDLLGRAGHINEAMNMINNMPIEADAVVWGSFLGACRTHLNMDFAEIAAKELMKLEPRNAGPYVLLSHIYASKGRWKDVEDLRHVMKLRKVRKSPGCSWIDVEKKIHMFTGGEAVDHPEQKAITGMLEKLSSMLRDRGYCPDGRFVLHDVDEEQKEHNLSYHSEKLALAYGLLKVPEGLPIRIMKNLRVCGDCHSAFKLIAEITGRLIILRDANRSGPILLVLEKVQIASWPIQGRLFSFHTIKRQSRDILLLLSMDLYEIPLYTNQTIGTKVLRRVKVSPPAGSVPAQSAADARARTLSLSLRLFYPLAGSLTRLPESDDPVIVYDDGDGVWLTLSQSDGDFTQFVADGPKYVARFHHLVPGLVTPPEIEREDEKKPLLSLQITVFPCSGICVGITLNHVVADGSSTFHFVKSWASIFAGGGGGGDVSIVKPIPLFDRALIGDVEELKRNFLTELKRCKSPATSPEKPRCPSDRLVLASFPLSGAQIQKLRESVLDGAGDCNLRAIQIHGRLRVRLVLPPPITGYSRSRHRRRERRPPMFHLGRGLPTAPQSPRAVLLLRQLRPPGLRPLPRRRTPATHRTRRRVGGDPERRPGARRGGPPRRRELDPEMYRLRLPEARHADRRGFPETPNIRDRLRVGSAPQGGDRLDRVEWGHVAAGEERGRRRTGDRTRGTRIGD